MNKARISLGTLTFLLAAMALMAVAAIGQTPATVKPQNPSLRAAPVLVFGAVDANHDGRISREEAQANGELTGAWSTLDSDRDAYLSTDEFNKWKAPAPGQPADGSSPQNATDAGSPASKPETAADKQDASTPQTATEAR